MNRQIAIGLIIGAIIALSAGYYTKETKYFLYRYAPENRYMEISTERYVRITTGDEKSYKRDKERLKKTHKYNLPLVGLCFLGGLGLGYLIADLSKKKNV
jgi:hypothetical protein